MHVYGSLISPFVQRVLMAARAKGHELAVRPPPGDGGLRSLEFRAMSPTGRIPVLELDDRTTLCESEAIVGYLDDTLAGSPLLPAAPLDRARVREIVAVTTLEVATGLRPIMVHQVFRQGAAPEVVRAGQRQAEVGLEALDRLLDPAQGFAVGEALGVADCALAPVLTLTRLIEPMTGAWSVVRELPRVAAYWDAIAADPIARRSIDEMTAGFDAMMARNAAPPAA